MSRSTQQTPAPDVHGVDRDPGSAEQELARLRTALDRVDEQLLDTVRSRIDLCTRIAQVKRAHAIPMLDSDRMAAVHAHAEHYAREHHLSPEFLDALYRLVIDEACRVENLVIDGTEDGRRIGTSVAREAEPRDGAR